MKEYQNIRHDNSLSELLQQVPLEQPSFDFTAKVMQKIQIIDMETQPMFYKNPVFISIMAIVFSGWFLLFYHANFSFSLLVEQILQYAENIYEFVTTIELRPRQITFYPLIIAPLLVIACIFLADRFMIFHKKDRQHRTFGI